IFVVCDPRSTELCPLSLHDALPIFLVSAAASGVGSIAGQIAKMQGARVLGIAGTAAKCEWVVDELGFDACIDYKTEDVAARLRRSEEHTSELQSLRHLVCRLLLEKK